jgi:hypothetical protein
LAIAGIVTGQAVGHLDEVVLAEYQSARTLDGADHVRVFPRHEVSETVET